MSTTLLALEFLAPVAGIVAASIAVPLLALLYFLKLRRRPIRVSSTLLWERAIQDLQVNAPFRWIRPSWLLLLQALILACLSLAAARPAVNLPTITGGRLILLIDRSGSMSARDGETVEPGRTPPTRLDVAKRRAVELIDRLTGSGAQAMVVSFAAQAQTVCNFTGDRGLLRNAIRAIEPTDQPDNIAAALKVVEAFASRAEESGRSAAPPRVVLFSDGGLNRQTGPLSAAIGRATFEFVRVGPEPDAPRDNIGIVALSARRDYEDPSVVRVFARLVSTLPDKTPATVNLTLDGETVEIRPLTVPPVQPDGRLGEAPLSFTLSNTTGGVLVLTLTRPDALPSDNAAALTLAPPSAARILLVQPGPPRTGIDLLLIDALRTLPPKKLTRMPAEEYEKRAQERGFFESFDLIVFDRVRPSELPPLPTMSFGATVPIPGLSLQPMGPKVAEFAFWVRTHPVMRYVSLSDVAIADPARIVTPDTDTPANRNLSVQTLASGPDGPMIVLLRQGMIRRLVLSFSLDSTYWWRDLSFPIFIANAVDYLTLASERGSGRQYTTAQPITILAPASDEKLSVTGPDGFTRTVGVDEDGNAQIGVIPLAGVYQVQQIPAPEGVIPVNMFSESESAIATASKVEVAGREAVARPVAGMAPREIWSWFVAAALVLIALEWIIFAWRIRIR